MANPAIKTPEEPEKNAENDQELPEMLKKYLEAPRYQIRKNMSEFLFGGDKTTPLNALVIEVSQFSFGILSRASIDRGDKYHLKIPPLSIFMPLDVIWSEQSQSHPGYWQSGLQLKNCNVNLLSLFVKAGLLKTKVPTNLEGRALVKFSDFSQAASVLHTDNSQLLAETGYRDLMSTHKSYGFRIEPHSYTILLLKSLKPKQLLEIDSYEAAQSIMVFREEKRGGIETKAWVKVWPSYGCIEERYMYEGQKNDRTKELQEIKITNVVTDDLKERLEENADQDIEIDV